jgi:hypothetical protein
LGADLIDGKAGAYSTLAQNIYDFHSGVITDVENVTEYTLRDAESLLQNTEKDNEPVSLKAYEDIVKALLSISSGLDIIAAEGDEYLMLFDDVLEKSGLGIDLKTRYQGALDGILNVNTYNVVDSDSLKYHMALTEIKSFGKNMEIIAQNVADVNKKAKMLLDRFENNPVSEYRDVESSNELKIFLKGFMLNWNDFVNMIAESFYRRLKALGDCLCKMEASGKEGPLTDNELSIESEEIDFTDYAFEDMVREFEEATKERFEALENSYYIERAKLLRGINVIFEADQPAQQNTQTTATQQPAQTTASNTNANKSNTKVQIQDNSAETGKGPNSAGTLAKLKADIGEFITGIITRFSNMFKKNQSTYDSEKLNNRSYTNVQVSVPNYNTDFQSRELKDPGVISATVKSMTPQVLQTIPDKKTLYQKLFAGTAVSTIPYDESNPKAWNDAATNMYKYGTNKADELQQYANNDLRAWITSIALPFCDQISSQISDQLTALGTAVDTQIKSYGGGQDQSNGTQANTNNQNNQQNTNTQQNNVKTESVSIFTEADANTPANNTEGSISAKVNWMREAIKNYCGIILNVLRDIGVDFVKILVPLTPKTNNNTQNQQAQPAQQNNNQQNTQQTNNTK